MLIERLDFQLLEVPELRPPGLQRPPARDAFEDRNQNPREEQKVLHQTAAPC